MKILWCLASALLATTLMAQSNIGLPLKPGRDANQPVDKEYTRKIREYTTETFFNSPLTDYLPASKTVPTPKAVLGDVAGAPGILPYSKEVYGYMRVLEKARSPLTAPGWRSSPIRVPSIWTTPRPKSWSPPRRPFTTLLEPSTRPRRAR